MQRITVNYAISRTTALTEGRAEYGNATYTPSDTELQFLSHADRQYLDKHERETFTLPTATPPTWPVIATAIAAAVTVEAERKAKEAAEQTAKLESALTAPDNMWIAGDLSGALIPGWGWPSNAPQAVQDDPRVVSRLATIRTEISRRAAEREQKYAAERAQREAEQATKEAARVAALESLTAWALASDDAALARAARDGYEVANAVLKRLADTLASELGGIVSTEGTKHWARWNFEDRAAPSAEAFEAWDRAKQAMFRLDKPGGLDITLHRIARVTVDAPEDDPDGQDEIYTAIVVMISAPGTGTKDRAVIVRVDPQK